MRFGDARIVADLDTVETAPQKISVYDREIGVRLLYEDPVTGEEHYLIRYPAGLGAKAHRHTAAHTIIVLEGRLLVNEVVVGPGSYCHFSPGVTMFHAPADDGPVVFLNLFHGPSDVEPVEA